MIIEIGKKYYARNGSIVANILTVTRNSPQFPIVAEMESGAIFVYTKDGKYSLQKEHPYDIVREVIEDAK